MAESHQLTWAKKIPLWDSAGRPATMPQTSATSDSHLISQCFRQLGLEHNGHRASISRPTRAD